MDRRLTWVRRTAIVLLLVDVVSWLLLGADTPLRPRLGAALPRATAPATTVPSAGAGAGLAGGVLVSYRTPSAGASARGAAVSGVACFLAATTPTARAQGLAGHPVRSLYTGVLLEYGRPRLVSHDTKGWPAPAELVYLSAAGRVVSLLTVAPCHAAACPAYPPAGPYRYALEIPTTGARIPLSAGSTVHLAGPCGP